MPEPAGAEPIGDDVRAETSIMMGAPIVGRPVERAADHPAVLARMRTPTASVVPGGVVSFSAKRNSKRARERVHLLQGALPDGRGVVAKRLSAAACAHERFIYDRVLPALGVAGLAWYGSVPDEARSARPLWWLFLEDAGGRPYHPWSDAAVKFAWLASAHRASARLPAVAALPDRGLDFERRRLRVAIAGLSASLRAGALTPPQAAVVRAAADRLEWLLAEWGQLAARCAGLPRVLVHGDLAAKNARVRRDAADDTFLAFDWETGGLGPPLMDLAELAHAGRRDHLLAYSHAVQQAHPALGPHAVLRCARLGALLRNAAAIAWEALRLRSSDPSRPIERMAQYHENVCSWLTVLGIPG